ncbi:uncharacterized protein LOC129922851 isoform X2 [Biomphalaria glabrata]|uniref:Uncharacterized protein LOC129922851 isoform X2 n=1 Tax=Biomphalaria glabrata TaxID=6526 RepID=A0A9W2YVD3_BIOGL|nr:uncharacterized protein LOC129922851 isoform X2 [Biomphalaria glabrata]
MAENEAGLDSSLDVYVRRPDQRRGRTSEYVEIMDINGTDYTVEKVKNDLLEGYVQDPYNYLLAFFNEDYPEREPIIVDQKQKITECIEYLHSNNYTIVFVKK